MPSCDYCDSEFEDEAAYLDHLEADHYEELDRIDRRRVDEEGEDSGPSTGVIAAVAVAVLLVGGGGAYALMSAGGDGGAELPEVQQRPSDLGARHTHGTIEVRIDDHTFDFGRGEFQLNSDYFHFEGGTAESWHVHANGVTLQYALHTLGIGVTKDRVVWEDDVYRRSDPGTNITITVNGEPVDPATYVLQDGDAVKVIVETGG